MATWTTIADTTLEPGKPVRSIDGIALRDNPIAIAEGAIGAPRIQNAAMGTDSVDNANVVNGTLGAEKFQTGTTERDWVLARTAGASVGALGTYALLLDSTATSRSPGDTASGSSLDYADTSGVAVTTSPPGTWRCMGHSNSGGSGLNTTVWLRIS